MPYVKIKPHYGNVHDLLHYITNEDKTDSGILVTGVNCHAELAETEFKNTRSQLFKNKNVGKRLAYHLVQSFHPEDDISPEEAHEIAVKMCKELYPDFQCVVSTHIDRGHIHNHIAINAYSLTGRKYKDKMNDEKEGLYAARNKSDEIAKEYGCFILPPSSRKFVKSNQKSDIYRYYKKATWKSMLLSEMQELKHKCSSLDEFIVKLFELGYDIKFGKYIAVKPQGKERYARLKTISEEFSEENLRAFYEGKFLQYGSLDSNKTYSKTEINRPYLSAYRDVQAMLLVTAGYASKNSGYPAFNSAVNKTYTQSSKLQQILDILNEENINSFDDLQDRIEYYNNEIHSLNKKVRKLEKTYNGVMEKIEKAQDYIFLSKEYRYCEYYKSIDPDYKLPDEMVYYEQIKADLGFEDVDDAKHFIMENSHIRKEINSLRSDVFDLQQKLYRLDLMKEKELLKSDMFIHNIKVGNNRIDYKHSTDKEWCIEIPYAKNVFVFIDKRLATYNHKNGYNTLFLVNDMKYDIYLKDKSGNLVKDTYLSGEQFDRLVADLKKENIRQHKNVDKNNPPVQRTNNN